jgi:hypothetical protein
MRQIRVPASDAKAGQRPHCPQCGAAMKLERIEPEAAGIERNTFVCGHCGCKDTVQIKPDDSDI